MTASDRGSAVVELPTSSPFCGRYLRPMGGDADVASPRHRRHHGLPGRRNWVDTLALRYVQQRGVLLSPCKNRSCPQCHTKQTQEWLQARQAEMLPTDYYHVTSRSQELRELLRANQRDGYAVLMKAAAEAIIELARDRRYVGGTVACSRFSTPGPAAELSPHVIASSPAADLRDAAIGTGGAQAYLFQRGFWPNWCAANSSPLARGAPT